MATKSAALEQPPLPSNQQEATENLLAEMDKIVQKLEKGKLRGLDDWAEDFSKRIAGHAKPLAKKK